MKHKTGVGMDFFGTNGSRQCATAFLNVGISPDNARQPFFDVGISPDSVRQPFFAVGIVPDDVRQPFFAVGFVPDSVRQPFLTSELFPTVCGSFSQRGNYSRQSCRTVLCLRFEIY